jgi:CheY-like chemotaxis protein
MPLKILLADKSITIQKVVEMLFSGKEYEVTCVSDGDSAFGEASRIVPDVVLADVDLPRIDGYSFAGRLRETAALAKIPVILMLSRDDVYDAMKGKLAGIVDNIAKPFESQELIGKVKKVLSAAPASAERLAPSPKPAAAPTSSLKPAAEPAPPPKPAAAPTSFPKPAAEPAPTPKPAIAPPLPPRPIAEPAPASLSKPREAVPKDIFDIIEEAPAKTEVKEAPAPPVASRPEATAKAAEPDEEMFEVEPEYEVEPEPEPETPAESQPSGPTAAQKADEEWAGLMQEETSKPEPAQGALSTPEAVDTDQLFGKEPVPAEASASQAFEPSFETEAPGPKPAAPPSFDFSEPLPAEAEEALPLGRRAMDEMREGLGLGAETARAPDMHPDIVTFESLDMASRASHEDYTFAPPETAYAPPAASAPPAAERPAMAPSRAPEVSDEMLKGVAKESIEKAMREILERVAWEVIPDLAERLIREEIERLKAESK